MRTHQIPIAAQSYIYIQEPDHTHSLFTTHIHNALYTTVFTYLDAIAPHFGAIDHRRRHSIHYGRLKDDDIRPRCTIIIIVVWFVLRLLLLSCHDGQSAPLPYGIV